MTIINRSGRRTQRCSGRIDCFERCHRHMTTTTTTRTHRQAQQQSCCARSKRRRSTSEARADQLCIFSSTLLGIAHLNLNVVFVSRILFLVSTVSVIPELAYTHDHRPRSPTLNLYIKPQSPSTSKEPLLRGQPHQPTPKSETAVLYNTTNKRTKKISNVHIMQLRKASLPQKLMSILYV